MRLKPSLVALLCALCSTGVASAQNVPLVYDVENTGDDCPGPVLPGWRDLPEVESLTDPFAWSDGSGRITAFDDWRCRRAEIAAEIQHYEMGDKPPPPSVEASYADGQLTITVTEGEESLTMMAAVNVPAGDGPFPAVIGVGQGTGSLPGDIFESRNIATVQYNYNDVATYGNGVGHVGPFYRLYPDGDAYGDSRGKFTAWAWGISRIIDALEQVPEIGIDTSHLAVTGCSFAGKISLFTGALDERVALTIAQEPGGGGAAAWRVSDYIETQDPNNPINVENLNDTDGGWYSRTFIPLFGPNPAILPYDHHELMGMVAPRALLVLGNPDYVWLAEESGYISSVAAQEVWTALGVPDRFGYSIVDGHGHCALPASQRPEVIAYVEKFLLGNESADTDVAIAPYSSDLTPWITWDTPTLTASTAAEDPASRSGLDLGQNLPNPFRQSTTIDYELSEAAEVTLGVYNVLGQRVGLLVDGVQGTGAHSVRWDGRADSGDTVPSGIYVYRLRVGGREVSKTMVLVR